MRGGFYNIGNIAPCRGGESKDDEPNNYCTDIKNDVILNIYKPKLNEFLEKIKADITKHKSQLQPFIARFVAATEGNDIFNIITIYIYIKRIKILTELLSKKKLEKKIKDEKKHKEEIISYETQLTQLKEKKIDTNIEKLLQPASKLYILLLEADEELPKFIKIKNDLDNLNIVASNLGEFIKEYYDIATTNKWSDKCIDNVRLEKILYPIKNLPNHNYTNELIEYFTKENLEPYLNNYKCLVPHNNTYHNLFQYLKGNNFKIYNKETISIDDDKELDIYYELYTYTVNHESHVYNNYLLEDYLQYDKLTQPIQNIGIIVNKIVLYPNYVEEYHDNNINSLSFILYNSENIFKKLIFALKINTINEIDIFLDRYIRKNEKNLILYHKHYTLLDVFIISNVYNIYYKLQQMSDPFINTDIYTDEYLQANIKNNFKNDEFIKYVEEQIKTGGEIDSPEYADEIANFNVIISVLSLANENLNLLINVYNYLFLSDTNISANNFPALERINIVLKYKKTQIFNLICLDLYKELLENYYLFKFYDIDRNIKILLNVFYYNSIYKLDKIKNLINYSSQFEYIKHDGEYYDIDDKYNKYNKYEVEVEINDVDIYDEGFSFYKNFYKKLFASVSDIKYVPYNYTNFQMILHYYKSNRDFVMNKFDVKNGVSACGEILIFNIINLLIYDDRINNINPAFLPTNTRPELKAFYENKKLSDFENRNIVLKDFIPLLHNIDFVKVAGTSVYNYHYIEDNIIKKGTEILPTYLNVCRILAHLLLGHHIDDGTNITCEKEILLDIFKSFGGSYKDILLKDFTFPRGFEFKENTETRLYFDSVNIFFSDSHGEMFVTVLNVSPEKYVDYEDNESLYNEIIVEDEKAIFNHINGDSNIIEKMRIIYSNTYYKPLFVINIYNYLNSIIEEVRSYDELEKIVKLMEYDNIEDMINKYIEIETHTAIDIVELVSKIFIPFHKNIKYDRIRIDILEKSFISNEADKLMNQIINLAFLNPALFIFLSKMKQTNIDIIFENILRVMTEKYTINKENILQYIKYFKPKDFDMNIFSDFVIMFQFQYKPDFIIEYLLTGVSVERQILMYKKLYELEDQISLNAMKYFRDVTVKLSNPEHIRILNESFTLLLGLLNLQDIDNDIIIKYIQEHIDIIIKSFPIMSAEIIEDIHNYCLFRGLIFLKSLEKTKFKGDFINIVAQAAPNAFSSDIGKELLISFNGSDDGSAAAAHQAKYLKYKRKYLQLKKYYNKL